MAEASQINSFSLGAQVGGPNMSAASSRQEQALRNALNRWTGDYTTAIRQFAFLLRIDGAIHQYTKLFNIVGARPAKRKRDWVEVEIGVPESWWRDSTRYKEHLTREVEKGLHSMIDLLHRNRLAVRADALLHHWDKIKNQFLRIDV